MKPHHEAWLAAHPERNADWLRTLLSDGFDVHHMDGNHENNAPDNLVLIDHIDHMRLHGFTNSDRLRRIRACEQGQLKKGRLSNRERNSAHEQLDRECYEKAVTTWLTWREIGHALGLKTGGNASAAAKRHATANGLPWPLRGPRVKANGRARA